MLPWLVSPFIHVCVAQHFCLKFSNFVVARNWRRIDIPKLDNLLGSRSGIDEIVSLRGPDAAAVMNLLDQVLNSLSFLSRICTNEGRVDSRHWTSLILTNVEHIVTPARYANSVAPVAVSPRHTHCPKV